MKNTALIGLLLLLTGCGEIRESAKPEVRKKPLIYTTFYPLQYFTQRIAGEYAKVACPIPAGVHPSSWQPKDTAIATLQSADHIITNGAGLEPWLEKVSLAQSRLTDTTKKYHSDFLYMKGEENHSHGPEGEHVHKGIDPHTWLDPEFALRQCDVILESVLELVPENAEAIRENYATLRKDLEGLTLSLENLVNAPLLASHPTYNYLAVRHGWSVTNLDLSTTRLPNTEELKYVQELPAKAILWEQLPSESVQQALSKHHVFFDPCFHPPKTGDYLTVMRGNIERLKIALENE